jgi:hypothetical protein
MTISRTSRMMRRACQGVLALALGAGAIGSSGCTMPGNVAAANGTTVANSSPAGQDHGQPPVELVKMPTGTPVGEPRDLCAYWDKDLQVAPDPLNHGTRVPCLVGRLILVDKDNRPVCCDGTMTVTLYDDQPAQGGPPHPLEQWDVKANDVRKMIYKDSMMMWGYTLAMPTVTCTPLVSKIHLKVEFKPAVGNPLYAESNPFKLKTITSNYHNETIVANAPLPYNPPQQAAIPPQFQNPGQPQQVVQQQYAGNPAPQSMVQQLQYLPGGK